MTTETGARAALAPAKVNLTLHLTWLRPDGYHLLESLVVFAGVGDRLEVAPAPDLTLEVSGPLAAGVPTDDSNLVLKAAVRLRALRGVAAGARIRLRKHLPHGAGIGGGSSDAAAALRLLADLWAVAPLSTDEALPLGADLPVCLRAPAPTVMSGIGERLAPAPDLPEGWLVLVNPGIHLSTAEMFKAHDRLYPGTHPGMDGINGQDLPRDFGSWLSGQGNHLTKVACEAAFAPVIGEILDRLRQQKRNLAADMSGSGSTVWGWFPERTDAASAVVALRALWPGFWVEIAPVLRPGDSLRLS